jgi:tyrosinase
LLPLPGARAADTPAPLKRVGIKEFAQNAQGLADLRKAVKRMRELPPRHPFSWTFQGNIHWRPFFPDYVYQQADESTDPAQQLFRDATGFSPAADVFNKCPHGNWWFLPWHRAYLYFFERILRWASGNDKLCLPYWNYCDAAERELPKVFRDPTTDGKRDGPPNPLYLPSTVTFEDHARNPQVFPLRDSALNSGLTQLTPFVASTAALNVIPFTNASPASPRDAFGGPRACDSMCGCGSGALESIPHNQVHNAIGGNAVQVGDALRVGFMGDVVTAARDPIFWLHHANIDRFWESWLALKDGRDNPQDDEWLNAEFTFYDVGPKEKPVPAVVTPRQLLNTKDLGYEYDKLEPLPKATPAPVLAVTGQSVRTLAATPAPPVPKIGIPDMSHMMEGGIKLSNTRAKSVAVPLQRNVAPDGIRGALAEKADAVGELYVAVQGIEFLYQPGVYYDVFLGLPKDEAPTPASGHYIGSISLFGVGHPGAPSHSGADHGRLTRFSVRLRVPVTLRKRLSDEKVDTTKLEVTFVPQSGTEPVNKERKPAEPKERTDAVTVRRVELLLVR